LDEKPGKVAWCRSIRGRGWGSGSGVFRVPPSVSGVYRNVSVPGVFAGMISDVKRTSPEVYKMAGGGFFHTAGLERGNT